MTDPATTPHPPPEPLPSPGRLDPGATGHPATTQIAPRGDSEEGGQIWREPHEHPAPLLRLVDPPDPANDASHPKWVSSGGWVELRLWAEMFSDVQKARIACGNRLSGAAIDVDFFAPQMKAMDDAERETRKGLTASFRRSVPQGFIDWQADTRGIGEHTLALLLGHTGHPAVAHPKRWEGEGKDRVLVVGDPFYRSLSQWRSYCGHGDANRKRRKGMTAADAAALGNPHAKRAVFLMAEACMKQRPNPYRDVYDHGRVIYAERDWTDGHRMAAALRLAGKAILADLWIIARRDLDLTAL